MYGVMCAFGWRLFCLAVDFCGCLIGFLPPFVSRYSRAFIIKYSNDQINYGFGLKKPYIYLIALKPNQKQGKGSHHLSNNLSDNLEISLINE